jgi:predicted ester cyclase
MDVESDADGLGIVLRHLERTDRRDLNRAAAACTPDVRFHGLCAHPLGQEAWKDVMGSFLAAFPDGHFAVEDVLADGDRVAVRHTFRGTHLGPFLGIPPTGRAVVVSAMVLYRVIGTHIAEAWWNADLAGLLRQLGTTPVQLQAAS